jgi:ABC-type multidrug transport system fused ATPase/permease subunit
MKALKDLLPYLRRYRKTLYLGFAAVLTSALLTVVQPQIIGRAIDTLKAGLAPAGPRPAQSCSTAGW